MPNQVVADFIFGGNSQALVNAVRQAQGALNSLQSAAPGLNQTAQTTNALGLAIVGALGKVVAFAGGIALLTKGAHELVGELTGAVSLSAEFQTLQTSFVSILADGLIKAKGGAALSASDLEQLRLESVRMFKESQLAAIATRATTEEYVTVLRTALATGQAVGLTQAEIEKLTLRMTLAAGALGISMKDLGTSVAQIFAGTVRVTNELGRGLGLATAAQRKLLKESIANGTEFDFLLKKTEQFGATALIVADNFQNVVAAIRDIKQLLEVAAVKPLFSFLSQALIEIRDTFVGSGGFKPAAEAVIARLKEFIADSLPGFKVLMAQIAVSAQELFRVFTDPAMAQNLSVTLSVMAKLLDLITRILSAWVQLSSALSFGLTDLLGLAAQRSAAELDKTFKLAQEFRKKLDAADAESTSRELDSLEEKRQAYIALQAAAEKFRLENIVTLSSYVGISTGTGEYGAAKQSLQELLQQFPVLKQFDIDSAEGLAKVAQLAGEAAQKYGKLTEQIRLSESSVTDLLTVVADDTRSDEKRASAKSALVESVKREAAANHETAKSYVLKRIAAIAAGEAQISASEAAIRAMEAEAIAAARLTGDMQAIGRINLASTGRLQAEKSALLGALAQLSATGTGGGKTKAAPKGRDELKDFIGELQRQLSLLREVGTSLSREADRIVQFRLKIVRGLADAGVIPFQQAVDIEQGLLSQQLDLDEQLVAARQRLIKSDGELAALVAKRQQLRDSGRDKSGTDKRQRVIEAKEFEVKQATEEVTKAEQRRFDIETRLFELGQRQAANRISVLEAELKLNDELAAARKRTEAQLAEVASGAGFVSPEFLTQKQFESDRAAREARTKEITRSIFPMADPQIRAEVLSAYESINKLIGKQADAGAFQQLQTAANQASLLAAELVVLNTRRAGGGKNLDTQIAQVNLQLNEANATIARMGAGLKLSTAEAKQLGDAFAILVATGVNVVKFEEGLSRLNQEERDALVSNLKNAGEQLTNAKARFGLELKYIEIANQQLDIKQQIIQAEKDFAIISDNQFRKQTAAILQQRALVLGNKETLLKTELAATSTVTPQGAARAAELDTEIKQLGANLFILKNQIFDLQSPLIAARDSFRAIGEAVGNLQGPAAKLKGVFTGLASLADAIAGKTRPKAPEETLHLASDTFKTATDTFLKAVADFAAAVTRISGGTSGDLPVQPSRIGFPNTQAEGKKVSDGVDRSAAAIVRAAGAAVAGVLNGIANHDIGQTIAGLAPLANLIPVAGPFIAAGLEIVGSITSYFSAAARKATEAMAKTISEGIADLKDKIASGAISLGEGIRELDQKLQAARVALSGRKGGAAELQKIEADVAAEQKRLRAEAKKIQDDFRLSLDLLREPSGLRDLIKNINSIGDQAKAYLASFENPADKQAAVADAIAFVKLSIKELKDAEVKALADEISSLKSLGDKFATDSRAVLMEGRISPEVSIATSKAQRLNQLAVEFEKQQKALNDQISLEQQRLAYITSREKLETKLARLTLDGGNALGLAADKLSNAADKLGNVFRTINGFTFAGATGTSIGSQNISFVINAAPGQSANEIGISVERQLAMSGLISPSRGAKYNPVIG